MDAVINVFNTIYNFLSVIIQSFTEFVNTIPLLFENSSKWISTIFPDDFSIYLVLLIPIIVSLLIIRFLK